ncbi:DUF6098 family protein [Kitasatospora sp. RB6PN24]|uniref:DUF6098 family protein n=1 Tax=Kitasatospora humi TaxID=2893891 RepID=UPI001E5B18F0|nr:DUF6098 family protein [Kitasatospora humi]MCC9306016.1 DUF6098 family protein [Kitasatospora humi]
MKVIDDLDDLTELATGPVEVFVRFSQGPDHDGETSRDYEADVELPGLSVASVRPEPWWNRPPEEWVARRICQYADRAERDERRRAWLLTGRVVGRGPDYEPLIAQPCPLAWLGPALLAQARRCYEERLRPGRDGTPADGGGQ